MNFKGATVVEEPKVKSLLKAMNLLDMFTKPPYEYGVSDLARKFGYPKSTVHNIFSTFTLCLFISSIPIKIVHFILNKLHTVAVATPC